MEVSKAGWCQGFLAEKFSRFYAKKFWDKRTATQIGNMINNGMDIGEWMTTGKTMEKETQWVIIDQLHAFFSCGN